MDIETVSENLAELLTNTVEMASAFYDIFLNPEPMDVTLKMFDKNNRLITVTIPNRAKDRVTPYVGEGSPEGVVEAPVGSTYVDTLTSTVYYKISGTDYYGWNAVISQSLRETFIRTYLEARGYVTTSSLNTYLTANNYIKAEDIATDEKYGVVKIDDKTIVQNANNQISVAGISDSNLNNSTIHNIWIGEETDYRNLYLSEGMEQDTIYILTDTGQILIGNTEVSSNVFPSSTSEEIALSPSGSTYTAPTNGWFLLNKTAGEANTYVEIINNTSKYRDVCYIPIGTSNGVVVCPALKGETVTVNYTASGAATFQFLNTASNRIEYNS
jgi:hypothetical protein